MKTNKAEKIQVLLSSVDYNTLKNIILRHSVENGQLMTVSSYVRQLIIDHLVDHNFEGEQKSFAKEEVKKIIKDYKNKNQTHEQE